MGGYGGLFATPYFLFLKSVLLPSYISVKKFGLFGALSILIKITSKYIEIYLVNDCLVK